MCNVFRELDGQVNAVLSRAAISNWRRGLQVSLSRDWQNCHPESLACPVNPNAFHHAPEAVAAVWLCDEGQG